MTNNDDVKLKEESPEISSDSTAQHIPADEHSLYNDNEADDESYTDDEDDIDDKRENQEQFKSQPSTPPQPKYTAPSKKKKTPIILDGNNVCIGSRIFNQNQLVELFDRLEDREEPVKDPPLITKFASPVALGLSSYSICFFLVSFAAADIRGVSNAKLFITCYIFVGGVLEILASLLCFLLGDTYAMVVFGTYGGFWLSWGCINVDQFHAISGYGNDTKMLGDAIGFYFIGWTVFTFLVILCSIKSIWSLLFLFITLFFAFLLLAIGNFTGSTRCDKAGGYFGFVSSTCGWWTLYCLMSTKGNSYVPLSALLMPQNERTVINSKYIA